MRARPQWHERRQQMPMIEQPSRRIDLAERMALWIGCVIFLLIPGRAALSILLGAFQ